MKVRCPHIESSSIFALAVFILIAAPVSSGLAASDSECYGCHGGKQASATVPGTTPGAELKVASPVDRAILEGSIHRDLDCVSCHAAASELPHGEQLAAVSCGSCHEAEATNFLGSVHGTAFQEGDPDVPSCAKCHGDHDILPAEDPRSSTYPPNLIQTCIGCHADEAIEARHDLPHQELFRAYEDSVHGRAIEEEGLMVAAACNDCHGDHDIRSITDPASLAQKSNIPRVCGKCHAGIYKEYSQSIHGVAVDSGIEEAPVCTDCHGEHTIAKVTDPESKVYSKNIPRTCSACHDDKEIVAEYGLAAKRYNTYLESYHGVANRYGVPYVANCATCHGVHDIRPAEDPLSTINKQNLPATCGKCHPGASENFALGKVHIEATKESSMGVYVVRKFYTWFIGILVTCFVLYALLETVGKVRRKYASKRE